LAKEVKATPEPKRQHYVPRFYLKGFVGEKDRLFVINRPTEKTFRTAPDNVAGENYFNRIEVAGMDPNAVEKGLAEFESETAPALERIRATKSLVSEEDRAALANLMAAVALRNPWRREAISAIYEEAERRQLAAKFGTKEAWEKFVADLKAAGVWNEAAGVTFEDMQNALKDAKFKLPKELSIALEIDQHDPLTELLWNRKWQMLVAAEGTGGFVTTDDPVCLRWSDGQPHGGLSPGFGLKETEIIFPLSTTLALRGSFEGEENVIEADAATVATINSLVISNAHNQVYAYDHCFKFMREDPKELGSGATLVQDKRFLEAGKKPEEGKVIALRNK
jgi:Protein of unknown function (DUF4238)